MQSGGHVRRASDTVFLKETDMIHCAICFHDSGTMYKTVYCALLSCFEHASEQVHVHALIDDSVRPYKHFLEELCASFHNRITFYEQVNVPLDIVNMFPGQTGGMYTEASLFRMCLHEELPEEVEKVVYFDCDIIFERDVADLWNMELGSAWMIAAHDPERVWSSRKKKYYLGALGIEESRYFNSGVLLMNLKALREASREENVFWRAYRQGAQKFAALPFTVFDQDLLNYLLAGDREKLKLVDASFNYELCLFDRRFLRLKEMEGKILHFPSLKPWQKFFPAQLAYWKYFIKTPWRDETMPMIEERIFDEKDRIWPVLLWIWRRHESLRWLARLRGAR